MGVLILQAANLGEFACFVSHASYWCPSTFVPINTRSPSGVDTEICRTGAECGDLVFNTTSVACEGG